MILHRTFLINYADQTNKGAVIQYEGYTQMEQRVK